MQFEEDTARDCKDNECTALKEYHMLTMECGRDVEGTAVEV
jgi:hypothetical protein